MMQIWFLRNGSYLLKICHIPFGKAIHPPLPYGKVPVEHLKSLHGASLIWRTVDQLFMRRIRLWTSCLFIENYSP